jgi:hypothetical protein
MAEASMRLVAANVIGSPMSRAKGSAAREVPEAKPDVMASDLVRGRRGRRTQRAVTININRLSKREIERGRMEAPPAETTDLYDRPKTRGDCQHGAHVERPCPFASCKHHLYLDANEETGSVKVNFPDIEVWDLPETCALDIADRGGLTLEEVGEIMNLARERVRQLETRGIARLAHVAAMASLSDYLDEEPSP